MARIRNIKPGYFTDADVAELSPLHRLLFPALWCHADRDGRLEDKPRELKVKCLPYDNCEIGTMLEDLHRAGFIIRYSVDGKRFIQIAGFIEHQRFHKDEKPLGLPSPEQGVSAVLAPPGHGADPVPKAPVSDVLYLKSEVGSLVADGVTAPVAPIATKPPRLDNAPTVTPDLPQGIKFFAWCQEKRLEQRPTLIPESHPPDFLAWFERAHARVKGDVERLQAAWLSFLESKHGAQKKPPFPMRVFQNDECWVAHVPELESQGPPRPKCRACEAPADAAAWGMPYCYQHMPAPDEARAAP